MQMRIVKADEPLLDCEGRSFKKVDDKTKDCTLGDAIHTILKEDKSGKFDHVRLAELGMEFCNRQEVKIPSTEFTALEALIKEHKGVVAAINCGLVLLQLAKSATMEI